MNDICNKNKLFVFDTLIVLQNLFTTILFNVLFKYNYIFDCRLEIKNVEMRKIFGGKLEKLTGGWREF
jgi:hypothetical protein